MHKLVLRLLDESGGLVGWTTVMAEARGDGALWAPAFPPIQIAPERDGDVQTLSIHWADLNVESRQPFPCGPVVVGQIVPLTFAGPLLKVGDPPTSLPAVTVRSSVVGVPVGGVGARGN